MPQDSLSSRIYKSFLTCNNPKGIVDKSTVRKKKVAPSKMEKRIRSRTDRKKLYEFSDCKLRGEKTTTKEVRDEFSSSSSSQLMEVSRGAQKLNRTIDLWSNGMKYDRQSDQIARDLFEGALDLQQSLVILGKLQEVSRYMTQMKKDERMERKTTGNIDMKRMCFNQNEFQKPRLSADYSYGDGAEELKKMIRDRLARQLLFPNTTNMAERISFPESSMESSASDFASTSSSQSSMMYNTTPNPAKKGNGKNLIAKLMGLEPQSKQMQENLHKQFLDESNSDRQRPKYSMEMAETKNPKSATRKIAQRTLESNLDTQQSKGINKHSAKEMNDYFNYSSYIHSREELTHTAPPIVLLKPVRVSQVELEERQAQVFEEDEAFNKKKFMKLKMKEKYHQQKDDSKVEALSSKKVLASIGAEETTISRIYHRKEAQNPNEDNWKPKECINVIKPKKRISHILLDQNLQKKEATNKKVLESQKEIVARKNLLSQAKIVPKFQDQVQGSLSKLQRRSNVVGEPILQDSTPTSDTATECSPFSMNQTIVEKVINEVSVEKPAAINFGGKSNVKKPDQTYSPASLLNMEEKGGSSIYQTCDYCSKSQSSLIHSCRTPESSKYIDHEISVTKPVSSAKTPISISPPPSSHTNELYHLNANGSSRLWISPEESPSNTCDVVESLRKYRKINETTNGVVGLSWQWPIRESIKEAEEVVEDLEERILVELIHEVFA
ncbi:uncharacterized protein LOC120079462 [Benincasa hispida]|uniref:uncharacterized protein LOC120079462 n=1 Tax=Benincasa hispida TaxID=102211 RepID=UPI0019020E6C|nr:uncharacterized protein LOC120079462 [Benincasa hispida]